MLRSASQTIMDEKPSEDVTRDGSYPHPRRPYVRLMTEKRREQNRKAQKVYREKLRKRLEELEDRVAAVAIPHPSPVVAKIEDFDDQKPSIVPRINIVDLQDAFAAAGDIVLPKDLSGPTIEISIRPREAKTSPDSTKETYGPLRLASEDFGDMDLRGIWPMPYRSPSNPYIPPPTSLGPALMPLSPEDVYQHYRRYTPKGRNLPHYVRPSSSWYPSSPSGLPDLYLNYLRLINEASLTATIAIAQSLGISRSAYINDHPSPFPAYPRHQSEDKTSLPRLHRNLVRPFDPPVVPSTAPLPPQAIHYASTKPALRPRPIQYATAHPAYLDCIIFSRLRERAVHASVKGSLDHMEFFLDLMHGGLVCWGSAGANVYYSGIQCGQPARSRMGMEYQVPWSTHSWEARRWFLRKWTWLIGTEEDELQTLSDVEDGEVGIWSGSRRWWSMRGETDDCAGLEANADHDTVWHEGDFDPEVVKVGAAGFR